MNDAADAVLAIVSCGAPATGVLTELLQRASPGHVKSPPPETAAVLLAVVPAAAADGVTGMTKLALALTARPAGIVQVTV